MNPPVSYIFPNYDLHGAPYGGLTTDGILFPPSPLDYDNSIWRASVKCGGGLFARVREWTLGGGVALYGEQVNPEDPEGPLITELLESGSFDLVCPAVDYDSKEALESEEELPRMGGWLGVADDQPGWDPDSENSIRLELWPKIGQINNENELGEPDEDGKMSFTFPAPDLTFHVGVAGQLTGYVFGKSNLLKDACTVTGAFPEHGDGFDNSGVQGFTLQLGAPFGGDGGGLWVVGSVSLNPTRFWSYRGRYNEATGAWIS